MSILVLSLCLNAGAFANDEDWSWFTYHVEEVAACPGFEPLHSRSVEADDVEVRIWAVRSGGPNLTVSMHSRGGLVEGSCSLWWELDYEPAAETHAREAKRKWSCGDVRSCGAADACEIPDKPKRDWPGLFREFQERDLWDLPEQSELPKDGVVVIHGTNVYVEARSESAYRVYVYSNPGAHRRSEDQQVAAVLHAAYRVCGAPRRAFR